MSDVPWARLMRLGLGVLRLSPESFWAMTPRELEAALTPAGVAERMGRDAFEALRARFPDKEAESGGT